MATSINLPRLFLVFVMGLLSGWLSSHAYTIELFYLEPVPIFLGFATIAILPNILKNKWMLRWLFVCLTSFFIYILVISAWFLPQVTMTLGSVLLLLSICFFLEIPAYGTSLLLSVPQLVAGIIIGNLPYSLFDQESSTSSQFLILFPKEGFPVFIWQTLAILSIFILTSFNPKKSVPPKISKNESQ
jgi:hypothetical protein